MYVRYVPSTNTTYPYVQNARVRIQAKHILLTYSCPSNLEHNPITTKESLLEFLQSITKYKGAVVCHELHESGKSHYHAAVEFDPKLITRNMRLFDFNGVHPNIGTKDNWKAMVGYVVKQNEWISDNVDVDMVLKLKKTKDKTEDTYRRAIALAMDGDVSSARSLLMENDPVRFVVNGSQIRSALNEAKKEGIAKRNPVIIKTDNWKPEYESIDINKINDGEEHIRTHVLVGKAGIGKTQLAKYLLQKAGCKNICVVRAVEQLKPHIDHIDGFVFDELNVNAPDVRGGRWAREGQIALVDTEVESGLPARYGDVIVPPHIKRIITTNMLDRAIDMRDEAISRRVTIHDLGDNTLFNVVN